MKRREFFISGAALALLGTAIGKSEAKTVDYRKLPVWKGFNLLEKFTLNQNSPYREEDFDIIADWKFNFVRLPMDYRCWQDKQNQERVFTEINQAYEYGKARNIHVNLCLHRAPGYCVNPPKEKLDLWADDAVGEEARRQFAEQWGLFALAFKGISNEHISFDLVNEPGDISAEKYKRAVKAAVDAIRAIDPNRLIIADGLSWGNHPVPELVSLKIAQSTRGYAPMQVSHFRASWVDGSDTWPIPTWPLNPDSPDRWDKARLFHQQIEPFKKLQAMGAGVHVGEWGAHNLTPHDVVLAWMKDQLALWKDAGWGWAMWNLRGSFGPMDSGRADVKYEEYKGHKLDRRMLELLRES
jgi:endoglucanase